MLAKLQLREYGACIPFFVSIHFFCWEGAVQVMPDLRMSADIIIDLKNVYALIRWFWARCALFSLLIWIVSDVHSESIVGIAMVVFVLVTSDFSLCPFVTYVFSIVFSRALPIASFPVWCVSLSSYVCVGWLDSAHICLGQWSYRYCGGSGRSRRRHGGQGQCKKMSKRETHSVVESVWGRGRNSKRPYHNAG